MGNGHDYTGHLARIDAATEQTDSRLSAIEDIKIGERLATIEANQANAKEARAEMKSDTRAILGHMKALPCHAQGAKLAVVEESLKTRKVEVNDRLRNLRTMFWAIVTAIIASAIGILVAASKLGVTL